MSLIKKSGRRLEDESQARRPADDFTLNQNPLVTGEQIVTLNTKSPLVSITGGLFL